MKKTRKEHLRELAGAEPDLQQLREEFLWAVEKRDSNVFRRQKLNYNSRFCIWPHQSDDGRKWSAPAGRDIFPWAGAADSRVPVVDAFIREDAAKLMVIWTRNRILASGTESNDSELGHRLTQVLRWMKYTQMTEARREARYLSNLFLERGVAALGVFWDKAQQLGYETLDLEEIKVNAMEVQGGAQLELPPGVTPEQVVMLPALIMDPSQEAVAAAIGALLYPDVAAGRLRQVVRDLRETGVAKFPRPYTLRDRPTVVALALNEDLFLAPEATDLRTARTADRRELLTESALRERVHSYGWDPAWVAEMIETQRGRVTADFDGKVFRSGQNRPYGRAAQNTDRLFEVIHAYRRLGDAEGVPGLYYTCYSPGVPKSYASHALLDYQHGELPFVLFEREAISRLPDDARGYGEVAATWQARIKGEWDSRTDRASIATLPPSHHPIGEPPDRWGPGVQIGTQRPDDYGFLDIPRYDPGSKEMELTVDRFARRYFGRPVDQENLVEAAALNQEMADTWMNGWEQADTQILQLMQQYMPESFFYRVVGSSKPQSIRSSREEIQGKFDVKITYNIDDLDAAKVAAKMGLVKEILMMDTTGRVDRDEMLVVAFELIDPNMGERLLMPAEQAAQAEIKDEKMSYAMMAAGLEVDVVPGNAQAYELRLKTLMQILQTNPKAQEMLQRDEAFRAAVEKRVKQLNHQLEQRENARIGVLGG